MGVFYATSGGFMFADMHQLPLNKDFYKDGCMYTTIEDGLTKGDGEIFAKIPEHLARFPIDKDEGLARWSKRHGEPLYQAIREYKPINKAKFDAVQKVRQEALNAKYGIPNK